MQSNSVMKVMGCDVLIVLLMISSANSSVSVVGEGKVWPSLSYN